MSDDILVRVNAIVKAEHRAKMNPSKLLRDLEPFKDLTGIKLYKNYAASDQLLSTGLNSWEEVDKRIAVPNTYNIETGELQFSGYFNDRYFLDWIYFIQLVFKELFEKITVCFWASYGDLDEHGIYTGDFDETCASLLDDCLERMQKDWSEYL